MQIIIFLKNLYIVDSTEYSMTISSHCCDQLLTFYIHYIMYKKRSTNLEILR